MMGFPPVWLAFSEQYQSARNYYINFQTYILLLHIFLLKVLVFPACWKYMPNHCLNYRVLFCQEHQRVRRESLSHCVTMYVKASLRKKWVEISLYLSTHLNIKQRKTYHLQNMPNTAMNLHNPVRLTSHNQKAVAFEIMWVKLSVCLLDIFMHFVVATVGDQRKGSLLP